jgi:hypothetical protein
MEDTGAAFPSPRSYLNLAGTFASNIVNFHARLREFPDHQAIISTFDIDYRAATSVYGIVPRDEAGKGRIDCVIARRTATRTR